MEAGRDSLVPGMRNERGRGEQTFRWSSSGASFLMTLWLEPQPGAAQPEWRWRVRHVQTGEEAYFRRLRDVLVYVGTRSGVASPR